MSRLAQRGKVICAVLLTLLIGEKLLGVAWVLWQWPDELDWVASVFTPLSLAAGLATLWTGSRWVRWPACVCLILWGGVQLLLVARIAAGMASVTPPEATLFFLQVVLQLLGVLLLLGIWHVLAGVALIALPSLRAFFDYQAMSPLQRQLASALNEE